MASVVDDRGAARRDGIDALPDAMAAPNGLEQSRRTRPRPHVHSLPRLQSRNAPSKVAGREAHHA